jgi:hypothetical protein
MNADLFDSSADILNGLAFKQVNSSSDNIEEAVKDLYEEIILK